MKVTPDDSDIASCACDEEEARDAQLRWQVQTLRTTKSAVHVSPDQIAQSATRSMN